jgi:hypothetical protein
VSPSEKVAEQLMPFCGGILEKKKFTVHLKLFLQFEEVRLLVEKWVLDV